MFTSVASEMFPKHQNPVKKSQKKVSMEGVSLVLFTLGVQVSGG